MEINKKNPLLKKIIGIFKEKPLGPILDLGCGDGEYSIRLQELGFNVIAADLDIGRFRYKDKVKFKTCDVTQNLPFVDESFDYVIFTEVIEHLRNPFSVIAEINRITKKQGKIILSTPNILSLKSRFRYLFEGNYEFFRSPPLEQSIYPRDKIYNLHVILWRYHELEYLLADCGFSVDRIYASNYEGLEYSFLIPIIFFQLYAKQNRSLRKNGINYSRINKIMLSREILFARHLIIEARKY